MYKSNARQRNFKREIETAFAEWKYIFLAIFIIILFYKII